MWKKFIQGLVFGCGFAVAFFFVSILGMQLYAAYQLESLEIELASKGIQMSTESMGRDEDVVDEAPAFSANSKKFLGGYGTFSQGFTEIQGKVLASGPGVIRGIITANGEPLAGLKLRLALNKAVMSQWGISGTDGVYTIQVPYGKYIVGGYELDYESADEVLAGLIDKWDFPVEPGEFEVGPDRPGQGLNLQYVDPVVKIATGATYKLDDDIVLAWQSYPGAANFRVQLREKQSAGGYRFKSLFDRGGVDVSNATTLDLAPYRKMLKPGHFYSYDVEARTADGDMISETAFDSTGYDFRIE